MASVGVRWKGAAAQMLQHKDHVMSVSPVSSPHVVSPPTTAPTQGPAAHSSANKHSTGTTSRPVQSSPAPGTGLKVDKHA
jgi:hypothetical protein